MITHDRNCPEVGYCAQAYYVCNWILSKSLSGVVERESRVEYSSAEYLVDFRTSPCPKVGAGKAYAIML